MLRQEQSQAAVSVIVPKFGDRENDGARGGGLNVKNSRTRADDYKIQSVAALI